MLRRNKLQYQKYKAQARVVTHARLAFYNAFYQLPLRKVFIKSLKSRWGSCSERGNLNFNYLLLFLPPAVQDYVIVHELCHLQEFNHSPAFWALVAKTIPNYRELRAQLLALERGAR